MTIDLSIAQITSIQLNQTLDVNGNLETVHFLGFGSTLANKVIPGDDQGKPAARVDFPYWNGVSASPVSSRALIGDGFSPIVVAFNKTAVAVDGVPAYSVAITPWTNAPSPAINVGDEVVFNGFTSPIPQAEYPVPGTIGVLIKSALVNYNSYTRAALLDVFFNSRYYPNLALPPNGINRPPEWVSVTEIKIPAGSRYRSDSNTLDIVFLSDYIIDITNLTPTSAVGGLTEVSEEINTWYYLKVGLDSTGQPLAWLDKANTRKSTPDTPIFPAAYSDGLHQVFNGAIFNNASSDIDGFIKSGNQHNQFFARTIFSGGDLTLQDLDLSNFVPEGAFEGVFPAQLIRISSSAGTANLNTQYSDLASAITTGRLRATTNGNFPTNVQRSDFKETIFNRLVGLEVTGVGTGSALLQIQSFKVLY